MAKRGTNKRFSQDQEAFVAAQYGGTVSPSSGAANNDSGDVRTERDLIECKVKVPQTCKKGHSHYECHCGQPALVKTFEKISEEAYAEGKSPVVALRFWYPSSILAKNGWVDLSVRLLEEDAFLRQFELENGD